LLVPIFADVKAFQIPFFLLGGKRAFKMALSSLGEPFRVRSDCNDR
jgi:hypothetical protein